ncbi:hypothetical protein BSL78_01810 [Apostichopus japonicus]|uniref:Uncharacterized protein n=1 Tax=Stichopus japonicus TaxID=307972 RepID=A0A2G8LLW3_STIJA|nr:hypothetical protein BSL78_01810 [Apostichopus japonicus]
MYVWYKLTMAVLLILQVTADNPFVFNATLDQQLAASDDELISNITDLLANRTEPVLADESGISAQLTSSIIELTDEQKAELSIRFSSLMADLTVTDGLGVVCPTTYGLRLKYMSLMQQNGQQTSLLQVLSIVQFVRCQQTHPPDSCLEQQDNDCYCCLRYRLQSVLAVAVQSCATGECQLVIRNINVPYCTCCQDEGGPMLVTTPTQSTVSTSNVPTTPTTRTLTVRTTSEASSTSGHTLTPRSSTYTPSSSPFYSTTNPRFTSRRSTTQLSSANSQTPPSSSTTGHDSSTSRRTTTNISNSPT